MKRIFPDLEFCVVLLALLTLGLVACAPPQPPRKYEVDQCMRARLFVQCMSVLPAGPVATQYNDWAEVVAECQHHAYRTALKEPNEPREACQGAVYAALEKPQ